MAAIQLAHYWLQTDRWVRHHNQQVEEQELARKEAEDLWKVEEHKRKEIEDDQKRRAEQAEKEKRKKEKGKEVVPEAGQSNPRKRKATEEPGAAAAKRPKVSAPGLLDKANMVAVRPRGTPE